MNNEDPNKNETKKKNALYLAVKAERPYDKIVSS